MPDATEPSPLPALQRADVENLVRDNERMRAALLNIRAYAEQAIMGGWRFRVASMVDTGLGR